MRFFLIGLGFFLCISTRLAAFPQEKQPTTDGFWEISSTPVLQQIFPGISGQGNAVGWNLGGGNSASVGGSSWDWPNTVFVVVEAEIDANAARAWIPDGMTLVTPATATYFIAYYPDSECCGPYYETSVLLNVRHNGLQAHHAAWMLVDNDVALVQGRDVIGAPKKMGQISIQVNPATWELRATVDRQGHRLLDFSGFIGAPANQPPPIFGGRSANVRGVVPSVGVNGLMQTPRIVTFGTTEEIILAREAALTVQINGSPSDPIDAIQPGNVVNAWVYRTNMGGSNPIPLFVWGEVNPEYVANTWALRYQ